MDTPLLRSGLSHERPLLGRARRIYPFANYPTPDVATVQYEQFYLVDPRRWSPAIDNRTANVPDKFEGAYLGPLDTADTAAYLVWESDEPEPWGAGRWRVRRLFSRIPGDQLRYPGSRYFTKPEYTSPVVSSFGGTNYGPASIYSPFAANGTAYYSSAVQIYTDGDNKVYDSVKAPTAMAHGLASAGTFTLTYGADTTAALAYNASGPTIAAALNALASVMSAGATVSVATSLQAARGKLTITCTAGSLPSAITMDVTGLTVSTSKNPTTQYYSSTVQHIKLPDHVTVASHGLSTSLALAMIWKPASPLNGGPRAYVYPAGHWGSVDANTLWLPPLDEDTAAEPVYVGTYSATFTPDAGTTYVGGSRLVRTRVEESFYLPGVTGGITTPADIAPPAGLQNPDDFLNAILTLSGWVVYESEGPAPWIGPIHRLAVTEINLADLA